MKRYRWLLSLFLLTSCAGFQRNCDSCMAQNVGADWIIVQLAADGHVINCWGLHGVSVSNEQASDGIYWVDHGNLVHISGWYNRVQISRFGSADDAAKLLGVDKQRCVNGRYTEANQSDAGNGSAVADTVVLDVTAPPSRH